MKILKKFILILVLVCLAWFGYQAAQQQGWLTKTDSGLSVEINTLQGNIGQQWSVLSSRAQELGGQAKNVLGSSVQVDESEPSLQEKAWEYGQYLYCKQVVTGYESVQR